MQMWKWTWSHLFASLFSAILIFALYFLVFWYQCSSHSHLQLLLLPLPSCLFLPPFLIKATSKFSGFHDGLAVKNLPVMQETRVQFLGWKDPWRRARQPTPVFLPGDSHGQRSRGHKESYMTETTDHACTLGSVDSTFPVSICSFPFILPYLGVTNLLQQ